MMEKLTRFDGIAEFVEVARSGSFTAAGVVLGLTGSAVGKSVTRLEARLGVKLLHRTTRKLTLTPEGEAYLDNCSSVIDQLESAETGLASGQADPIGRIRLDLPAAFGRRHILPVLTRLSVRHARLDFSVMFTERTSDLIAEGIDLAVRIGTLTDDADLVARPLGSQRLIICASPDYLSRYGVPVVPDELTRRDCIIGWRRISKPTWLLKNTEGQLLAQDIHVRHEFSDGEAMVGAVLDGCGLCQLPTWLISEHLASGALVPVLPEFAGAEMPIHAIWPKSRYVRPKLRVVIDALIDAAQTDQVGFHG